ncbi:MAG: CcmD family protein [Ginsengibacter sp.]
MLKKIFKRIGYSMILSFFSLFLFAQATADSNGTSMDTTMRSNDKIYVVMAVCTTILIVLFLYLIRIDRKVSRKEKNL